MMSQHLISRMDIEYWIGPDTPISASDTVIGTVKPWLTRCKASRIQGRTRRPDERA